MSQAPTRIMARESNVCTSLTVVLCISDESFLLETGNMLIMTYAQARASGDGSLISRYVCGTSNPRITVSDGIVTVSGTE